MIFPHTLEYSNAELNKVVEQATLLVNACWSQYAPWDYWDTGDCCLSRPVQLLSSTLQWLHHTTWSCHSTHAQQSHWKGRREEEQHRMLVVLTGLTVFSCCMGVGVYCRIHLTQLLVHGTYVDMLSWCDWPDVQPTQLLGDWLWYWPVQWTRCFFRSRDECWFSLKSILRIFCTLALVLSTL